MNQFAHGTLLVVADEEKALILENTGDARQPRLTLVTRIDVADLLATADRSARLKDHPTHETTEPADYPRMGGARLASAVASALADRARKGMRAPLVLVAAPQVLGALRDVLDDGLRSHIIAEFAKTLTGHPLPRIAELVQADLAEL